MQVSKPIEPDELALKDQAEKIIDLLPKSKAGRRLGGYFPIASKAKLRQVIKDRFAELAEEAEKAEDLFRNIGKGKLNLINKLEPEWIKALDIPPKQLERLMKSQGAQLFSYAFVWEKNHKGLQQARKQLLMSEGDLRELHKVLGEFFGSSDVARVPTQKQLADHVSNLQAGQDFREGEGCSNIVTRPVAVDLPKSLSFQNALMVEHRFAFRSPLLTDTLADVEKRDQKEIVRLYGQLNKKLLLIDDILKKKKYRYGKLNDRDESELRRLEEVRETLPGEFDRSFHLDSRSAAWYWLDYDQEWP